MRGEGEGVVLVAVRTHLVFLISIVQQRPHLHRANTEDSQRVCWREGGMNARVCGARTH